MSKNDNLFTVDRELSLKKKGKKGVQTFRSPTQRKQKSPPVKPKERIKRERRGVSKEVRTIVPSKRKKVRYPFDFYADQIDQLRQLRAEAMMRGENYSMSKLVREALDKELNKQGRTEGR